MSGFADHLEIILFGAVHDDISEEDKLEAAREIRRAANRCPLVIDDWSRERERADAYREAALRFRERLGEGPVYFESVEHLWDVTLGAIVQAYEAEGAQ